MRIYLQKKGYAEPQVGDIIQHNTKVIKVSEPVAKDIFKLTFKDDTVVYTSNDQVWTYYSYGYGGIRREFKTTFEEFYKKASLKDLTTTNYDFPALTTPYNFTGTKYTIHPFLAGYISASSRYTKINARYLNELYKLFNLPQCSFVAKKRLLEYMKESWWKADKFNPRTVYIPDEIKYGSITCRKSFLQGLFLNKGKADKGKNKIIFRTSSKVFADDLIWLIKSMGSRARKRKEIHNVHVWVVTIELNDAIFYTTSGKLRNGLVNYEDGTVYLKRLRSIQYVGQRYWSEIYTTGPYANKDFVLVRGDLFGKSEKDKSTGIQV